VGSHQTDALHDTSQQLPRESRDQSCTLLWVLELVAGSGAGEKRIARVGAGLHVDMLQPSDTMHVE
jgi:hypothetical protein